jgi:transglutaminase-like putative cysteine protease
VATGAAIIGVAVVAGTAAGPNLPGADAEALVAWRDLNQSEPTRVVLSPLVSMQTSLVEQSNVEVFTVRSTAPSYWRLTALNEFDGEIWRSSYSTDEATGTLPRALDTEVEGDLVSQQVTIEALQAVWLPAAYEPVEFSATDDQPAVIDERSSTLMVDRANSDSDGYTYTVTSRLPELDADRLRTASAEVPDDIAETYLQLPDDFSEQAAGQADDLTRDQPTPYDKARAIQDHLRTFAYDTNVPPGHSEDALVTFLFETQRGYCEQFSAAFAALARSAGLPSRVAVGFTSGVQYPDDPTLFRVRGVHAHAWPEVYLGEYGWVPFEPTPGRGPPGAEAWLGIAPGQDTSFGGAAAGADSAAGAGDGLGSPTGLDVGDGQGLDPNSNLDATAQTAPGTDDDESWAAKPIRQVARPVAFATAAYLLVVPLALVGQRLLRRRRARTPAARARRMWNESVGSAMRAGVSLPPSLTIAEQADRMARSMPALAPAIQSLARTMEAIAYAEVPPTADDVERAEESWAAIGAEANRRQSWWRRVLKYLDVRLLFAGRSERRVAHQGPAVNPAG